MHWSYDCGMVVRVLEPSNKKTKLAKNGQNSILGCHLWLRLGETLTYPNFLVQFLVDYDQWLATIIVIKHVSYVPIVQIDI